MRDPSFHRTTIGFGRAALLTAILCLTLACSGGDGAPAKPHVDRLPDDWDSEELLALVSNMDVIKTVENELDVEVLQWKVEENDRPQRIQSGLIWVRFLAGEREDWMLAHVIRASGADGEASPWSLAVWQGTPQKSHEYYEQPPGSADVRQFIRATWWSDEPISGNRMVDSAVRTQAWKTRIGEPPPAAGG